MHMKHKGMILIFAGIFVILGGAALYGFVGLSESGFTYADFATRYEQMTQLGQADLLAGNSALGNFLIRYYQMFAIAAAVALVIGAAACIFLGRSKEKAKA